MTVYWLYTYQRYDQQNLQDYTKLVQHLPSGSEVIIDAETKVDTNFLQTLGIKVTQYPYDIPDDKWLKYKPKHLQFRYMYERMYEVVDEFIFADDVPKVERQRMLEPLPLLKRIRERIQRDPDDYIILVTFTAYLHGTTFGTEPYMLQLNPEQRKWLLTNIDYKYSGNQLFPHYFSGELVPLIIDCLEAGHLPSHDYPEGLLEIVKYVPPSAQLNKWISMILEHPRTNFSSLGQNYHDSTFKFMLKHIPEQHYEGFVKQVLNRSEGTDFFRKLLIVTDFTVRNKSKLVCDV